MLGGENVGRAYVKLYANGDEVPDDVEHALDKLTPAFRKAGQEHADAWSEWFRKQAKTNEDANADAVLGKFRSQLHEGLDDWKKIENQTDRVTASVRRLTGAQHEDDDINRHWLSGFHNRLVNVNQQLEHSADHIGRLFGKGSRNNFFNILGRLVEQFARIPYYAGKAGEAITGIFTGEGGSAGQNLSKLAGGLAIGIAGITIAISALVLVLGPVAALLSGITAAVIALAGSLVFAAGAVGGVALALAGPFAASIGVGILALTHLDKQTQDVVKSMSKEFGKLGDSAGKELGPKLRKAIDIVRPEIANLEPLVDRVSRAIGRDLVRWAKVTETPEFKIFVLHMTTFLPRAIDKLGIATKNTFEGILGIIRASTPITSRFLTWLVEITGEFSKWANSGHGQTELGKFFDRAARSAKVVGGLIKDIVVATAILLSGGKRAGDDIFTSLDKQVQHFIDFLRDPNTADSIAEFFANGKQVASDLGDLIIDLADIVDSFDTSQSRKELHDLFDALDAIASVLSDIGSLWSIFGSDSTASLNLAFNDKQNAWGKIKDLLLVASGPTISIPVEVLLHIIPADLRTKLDQTATIFGRWASRTAFSVAVKFRGLGGRITDAIGSIDWVKVVRNPIPQLLRLFDGLAGRIAHVMGDVDWSTVIPNPIAHILGEFHGLGGKIEDAIGSINVHINWPDPPGWLSKLGSGLKGAVTANGGVFSGAQHRIIGEAGPEAVVPLARPLGQVDPSVRALSAFAQGLGGGVNIASGAITVVEAGDAKATARAMLNELVARMA